MFLVLTRYHYWSDNITLFHTILYVFLRFPACAFSLRACHHTGGKKDSESHDGSISPWQAAPAVSEPPGSRQRGGAIDPGWNMM